MPLSQVLQGLWTCGHMLWALYKPEASAKGTSQLPAPCKPETPFAPRLGHRVTGHYTSLKAQRRGRASSGGCQLLKAPAKGASRLRPLQT